MKVKYVVLGKERLIKIITMIFVKALIVMKIFVNKGKIFIEHDTPPPENVRTDSWGMGELLG